MRRMIAAGVAALVLGSPPVGAQQASEPGLQFAFEEIVTLSAAVSPGPTPKGGRNIIPITGGRFAGPGRDGEGIRGEVMPGGWDWQLIRPDGCIEVEANYFLKTDDGVVINIINKGNLCAPQAGQPPSPGRTHPVFEAPNGKYDWLNKAAFIGTLELAAGEPGPAVKIRIYRVT